MLNNTFNCLTILLLSWWWTPALCQQLTSSPTKDNFLRRAFHKAVIQGHFLYIDGGELDQVDSSSGQALPYVSTQNTTLSIDLRTSWTNESVVIQSIDKGSAPVLNGEWLWQDPDGKTLYMWGGANSGWVLRPEPDNIMWTFVADGNGGGSWDEYAQVPSSLVRTTGSLVTNTGDGFGYAIGGTYDGQTVQGIISYDIANQIWNNGSTVALSPNGTALDAQLVYTDAFGENGILIALGGEDGTVVARAINYGNPPEKRGAFCAIGVHSESSMEIFMFGGSVGAQVPTFDDIHILSLPSFSWYKADYAPGLGRCFHRCVQIGRQMIVVGGMSNGSSWLTSDFISATYQDPWPWGLGVFDMSKMQWASQYSANAADYVTPDMVAAGIAANGSQPVSWTSSNTKSVFSHTTLTQSSTSANSSSSANPATSSSSTATSSSTPGNSSAASSANSGLSGGAIAGIAIGTVALVLLVLGALRWMRKSKRQARQNAESLEHQQAGQHDPHETGGAQIFEKSTHQHTSALDLGPNSVRGHQVHEKLRQTDENYRRHELA